MFNPNLITEEGFQNAWIKASRQLSENKWELRNLIVYINNNVDLMNNQIHNRYTELCNKMGILSPKAVAYTIFPHGLYKKKYRTADELFTAYNKTNGFYDKIHRAGWGNYFRRMTKYENTEVNQLKNIIDAINNRKRTNKAAYTIIIQKPGGETIRPLGGPCLNYLAVQLEPGKKRQKRQIGLLAVYRNHDFLKKAYGNYWGLCNLLCFLARETDTSTAALTCISSRAYVDENKRVFRDFLEEFK